MGLRLAVKEWAGVIEALSKGIQIILVRKYPPDEKQFLLYPTYSYYSSTANYPDRFDRNFQKAYRQLARDAALEQLLDRDVVKLQYVFEVQDVMLMTSNNIKRLAPCMIWSVEHVKEYAERYNGLFVWSGRIKRLPAPILAARQVGGGSLKTYTHFEDVDVLGVADAIADEHFRQMSFELKEAIGDSAESVFF